MRKNERVRFAGLILMMLCVSLVCVGSAYSGQFRPYVLPDASQQQVYSQEQKPRSEPGKIIDESTYDDFQKKVSGMTPDKRADLRAYFSKKRDQAQELQEYKYYTRLIEIMDKK
jgi:hypothetical protein